MALAIWHFEFEYDDGMNDDEILEWSIVDVLEALRDSKCFPVIVRKAL